MTNPTPNVSSKYGAPMGRASREPNEVTFPITLREIGLDSGGYDVGGAYWGIGEPLFHAGDAEGDLNTFFRAKSREAAKAHVQTIYPGAEFAPAEVSADDVAEFLDAYVECALWSSTDMDTEEPLDANHSDVHETTRAEMLEECKSFMVDNADDIAQAIEVHGYSIARAGHDFWLTRNHHGAGFWDRGLGDIGKRLTDAAHACGEVDLYVGDDGEVYQ